MALTQEKMASRLRDIAMLLEREEVRPRLLKEVEEFIKKFPLAEFSTCSKDKLCFPGVHQRSWSTFSTICLQET